MSTLDVKLTIQTLLGVKADGDIGPGTRARFEMLARTPSLSPWPPAADDPGNLLKMYGHVKVTRTATGLVRWRSGVTINVDGAPDAYHPDNHPGRDLLANAGHPGNWWGVAVNRATGRPYVQGEDAPIFSPATKGFLVSTTALVDNPEYPENDCRRYCNPDEVAGAVIPLGFPVKIRMGTPCRVSYNGKTVAAIIYDAGPPDHIGEISTLLARRLGIPDSPRTGGVSDGVDFEIQT